MKRKKINYRSDLEQTQKQRENELYSCMNRSAELLSHKIKPKQRQSRKSSNTHSDK